MENERTLVIGLENSQPFIRWVADSPQAELTSAMADALIHALGDLRAGLDPAVATSHTTSGPYLVQPDPVWYIEGDALLGLPLMHLRHPGLGWIRFLIPRHEAKRMAEVLTAIADAPEPSGHSRPS